jgi:glutamyl-tRNA reductase
VGKRARSETEIGRGTVSVAYAAVEMAQKIFDGLERHAVLVIGAGETGALAARHFSNAAPKTLTVVNRTYERAGKLAEELGGRALRWEELDDALAEARVVVTATGAQFPTRGTSTPRWEEWIVSFSTTWMLSRASQTRTGPAAEKRFLRWRGSWPKK